MDTETHIKNGEPLPPVKIRYLGEPYRYAYVDGDDRGIVQWTTTIHALDTIAKGERPTAAELWLLGDDWGFRTIEFTDRRGYEHRLLAEHYRRPGCRCDGRLIVEDGELPDGRPRLVPCTRCIGATPSPCYEHVTGLKSEMVTALEEVQSEYMARRPVAKPEPPCRDRGCPGICVECVDIVCPPKPYQTDAEVERELLAADELPTREMVR